MLFKQKPSLQRELIVILCIKCLLLGLIWRLWFSHPVTPLLTPQKVAERVL